MYAKTDNITAIEQTRHWQYSKDLKTHVLKYRVKRITKDKDDVLRFYNQSDRCVYTNSLERHYNPYILEFAPNIPDWKLPILHLEVVNTTLSVVAAWLDGVPLYSDILSKRYGELGKYIASIKPDENIERRIEALPLAYKIGLKAMFIMATKNTPFLQYITFLTELNEKIAKVIGRYSETFLQQSEYPDNGLAQDFLNELGVKDLETLDETSTQVVQKLLGYMAKIYQEVQKDTGYLKRLEKSVVLQVMPDYLSTWRYQDIFETGILTKKKMEALAAKMSL